METLHKGYITMPKLYKTMVKPLKRYGYDVWYSNIPDTFVISVDDVDLLAVSFKVYKHGITLKVTDTDTNNLVIPVLSYGGNNVKGFITRMMYRITPVLSSYRDVNMPWTELK